MSAVPGVYILWSPDRKRAYVGEAADTSTRGTVQAAKRLGLPIEIRHVGVSERRARLTREADTARELRQAGITVVSHTHDGPSDIGNAFEQDAALGRRLGVTRTSAWHAPETDHSALLRVEELSHSASPVTVSDEERGAVPWSVLLWTVPGHVRMNGRQICEALDRGQSWLHHHSSPKYAAANGLPLLPVRRGRGGLWTTAGELREWVDRHWGRA